MYKCNQLAISLVRCLVDIETGNLPACRDLLKSGDKITIAFFSELSILKETQRKKINKQANKNKKQTNLGQATATLHEHVDVLGWIALPQHDRILSSPEQQLLFLD